MMYFRFNFRRHGKGAKTKGHVVGSPLGAITLDIPDRLEGACVGVVLAWVYTTLTSLYGPVQGKAELRGGLVISPRVGARVLLCRQHLCADGKFRSEGKVTEALGVGRYGVALDGYMNPCKPEEQVTVDLRADEFVCPR